MNQWGRELKYNKKASNVSSLTDKKGFYFTEAGFWIEEVVLSKNLKVFIKPLKGSLDTVVRLTMEDSDVREKNSNKIHEAADVFYHLIMFLEAHDVKIEDIMEELKKRKKWVTMIIIFLLKF